MFEIKSDGKSLDVKIKGVTIELVKEFGAIIRSICYDFISKTVDESQQKDFAEKLAMCYAREIHAAYLETQCEYSDTDSI